MLDDERCILCSRCVRFSNEVAGEDVLGFVDQKDILDLDLLSRKGAFAQLFAQHGRHLSSWCFDKH